MYCPPLENKFIISRLFKNSPWISTFIFPFSFCISREFYRAFLHFFLYLVSTSIFKLTSVVGITFPFAYSQYDQLQLWPISRMELHDQLSSPLLQNSNEHLRLRSHQECNYMIN
eukprot:TRINITY_DN39215_c1_g1_i1.p1 TRINITY_DN39215_c1_g1~~TRINITY_DN39215_c1_g1_i1.p1  ORF type:complete len:114 (+),score=2.95 TRINITY_DN39215_c1_g1_i1:1086-1427(+)